MTSAELTLPQTESLFFRLPRELRDEVYFYYVWDDSGYRHDPASDTLRTSDNEAIDLALQYSCKAIAKEMEGLALKVNRINFSTIPNNSTAERFDTLVLDQSNIKGHMLGSAHGCITPAVIQKVAQRYPGNPLVERFRNTPPNEHGWRFYAGQEWQECPFSLRRDITHALLQGVTAVNQALGWHPELWTIPGDYELCSIQDLQPQRRYVYTTNIGREYRLRSFYSAATAAIHFLRKIRRKTRLQVRNIILNEDFRSGAFPECHAHGLIPACQENPQLHIERRVDVWYTALNSRGTVVSVVNSHPSLRCNVRRMAMIREMMNRWIQEATALRSLGMPSKSFSLVFTGYKNSASDLWNGLKSMAAIEETIRTLIQHGVAVPEHMRRLLELDNVHGFSRAIREIVKGETSIHFDGAAIGELWDINKVASQLGNPWIGDWEQVFGIDDIEQPPGGFVAVQMQYVLDEEPDERRCEYEY